MSYTRGSANKIYEKIRQFFTVNPDTNTGIPLTGIYRTPSPGSQPKIYKKPITKHSDLADNYYFSRDSRRNYPRLAVYTQKDVAGLIAASNLKSITTGEEGETKVTIPENMTITEAIASTQILFDSNKLPPVPTNRHTYNWKKSTDAKEPDPG
ncbi:9985_t:CDS:2 [Diversispora eburnea]|uniref:9985_t:CDS:1 n=1 Tax=Diversispora eburnea TaxID=1213867 RepID=A0A9N8W8U4_9GLOM|nr:9985_t:CDS:2 [Diversispora eburnea]